MKKFINTTSAKVSAIATVAFVSGASDAYAQGFQGVTENIQQSVSTVPGLISTLCYIAGAGLGVAGVFKLKEHVDNPGQSKMKDGLIRLGAGGGLLALPFVLNAMLTTIGDQGTTFTPNQGLGNL